MMSSLCLDSATKTKSCKI